MSQHSVKEILKNPSAIYDHPQDVVKDSKLSKDEKDKVLKAWEDEAQALLRAEGESMNAPAEDASDPSATGELLKNISKLREDLES